MISTHVPSLELCKKISDLGWKKETMFFWKCDSNGGWTVEYRPSWDHHIRLDIIDATIPAPTVGEMMEELPPTITLKGNQCRLEVVKTEKVWTIRYWRECMAGEYGLRDESLADGLASMLCGLIENNLVKLEEKE